MRAAHIIVTFALTLPTVAMAQDPSFEVQSDRIVGATMESMAEYPNGAGAPTIAWDAASAKFVMFFETEVTSPGCDQAWAIGSASSVDGYDWTPGGLQVEPVEGTGHACGARNPALVISDDGTRYLFFNVVDESREDQVALMRMQGGRRSVKLLPDLDGLIAPSVANWEGEFILMGISSDPANPAIVTARSTTDTVLTWTIDATDAVPAGATPWAVDGHQSPALLCEDATSWEWELYYGGTEDLETSWAYAVSNDAAKWYVSAPLDTWAADSAWKSWDLLRMGSELLAVYETVDADGKPQIGLAATADTWSANTPSGRWCNIPL